MCNTPRIICKAAVLGKGVLPYSNHEAFKYTIAIPGNQNISTITA